jgi:uroporphyrinogen decarboxylase
MTSRERFLAACAAQPLDRPPVWIMRQAGRYLPEYRALKERHGFQTMVRTPELAAEVTLQPLRRFAFDAGILFSDILVVPEALGQGYRFRDQGGIAMDYRIERRDQIEALAPASAVPERLAYVRDALALLRNELGNGRALLGFSGSPWTLSTYMVEGGGSENFVGIKSLFYADRPAFELLLEKLTSAVIAYCLMQIAAGADAIQIFDSWGGAIAEADYEAASLRWIRRIAEALPKGFPLILFLRSSASRLALAAAAGVRVLGIDWTVDLPAFARSRDPSRAPVAVQGNLDPSLLNTDPAVVRRETERLLGAMRGIPGHIFNLGHGILPDAKIPCVEALVESVVSWR